MLRLCLIASLLAVSLAMSVPMPGGWMEHETNDPAYTRFLDSVYYPQSIGKENLTLIKVETQVVAGVNFKYTFLNGNTNSTCYGIVFHQPWSGKQVVLEDTCAL